MGRNKTSAAKKKLRGNPGKRDVLEEYPVESPPLRCPPGLSKAEKKYWRTWGPSLIQVGKLTKLALPSFLTMVKMKVRLDSINDFLGEEDANLLQKTSFVDTKKKNHTVSKESTYARMSRDLTPLIERMLKRWGLTGDSAGVFIIKKAKSAEEGFLE
jgi:hypothetical protein